MTNDAILDSLVSDACIALFGDYALPLRRVPTLPPSMDASLSYCAEVEFEGEQMRGALLLAATPEPLDRTSPVADTSSRDWIAELSNQLLGRIKSKLVLRGVVPQMSTPVVTRDPHFVLSPRTGREPYVFECDMGHVCVWLDAELAQTLDLTVMNESVTSLSEGEALLF